MKRGGVFEADIAPPSLAFALRHRQFVVLPHTDALTVSCASGRVTARLFAADLAYAA